MRQLVPLLLVVATCLFVGLLVLGRQIHIPSEVEVFDHVIIAETGAFYGETKDGELIPKEFQAWPGEHGLRSADWFDVRIEADRGDAIVLAPGLHKFDLWVFSPGITITTEEGAENQAEIWGTVEVDADSVTLDSIAVIGPRKGSSSGHGIELDRERINQVTIQNCRIEDKEWMGIHVIGPRGEILELRVENCQVLRNGSFGIEAQSVAKLVITGCTITGNSEGVHVGSNVDQVEMWDNNVFENRIVDVYRKP